MRGWHEGATCRSGWIWVKDDLLVAFCGEQHHVDDDGNGVHDEDGGYDGQEEDNANEVANWSGSEMRQ